MRTLLNRRTGKGARAFTLIELMIAIAVLVILAAIAVPNFAAYRDKAIKAKCLVNMALVRQAYTGFQAIFPTKDLNALKDNLWQYTFFNKNYTFTTPKCPLGAAYAVTWLPYSVSGSVATGGFQVTCKTPSHTNEAD